MLRFLYKLAFDITQIARSLTRQLSEQRNDTLSAIVANLHSFFVSPPNNSPNATSSHAPTTTLENISDLWYSFQLFLASRSQIENTSLLLATVAFVFSLMSWSSRIGQYAGRFSPFGRSTSTEDTQVNDGDYSYITSDDLKRGDYDDKSGPPRDTDLLVLKSKKMTYPVHFPAYSIDRGELTIGAVRDQAAKKTGTSDAKRIKLLYRGKNLKDDTRACRAEGLKAGAEIMCSIADALQDDDDSDDSDSDGLGLEDGEADGDKPKRKRNRNRNKKRKGRKHAEPQTSDTLPVPSVDTSRSSTPKAPTGPLTPVDKLNALNAKLLEFVPMCKEFITNPPSDQAKKNFEHKRLSETILAQVLLKLDAVETDEPDARAVRKELVKETQRWLTSLDEAMK